MFSPTVLKRSRVITKRRPFISLRTTNFGPKNQTRAFGDKCNQFDPGVGGPGGQEIYPYSSAFHRICAIQTSAGVLLSGAALYALKRFQRLRDSVSPKPTGTANILIHDLTKGELDDVKLVRAEDLGKLGVAG